MPAVLAAPATTILMPGDPGWDDARQAWSLSVDQHPAAVALPASAQDVVDVVRFARRRHGFLRDPARGGCSEAEQGSEIEQAGGAPVPFLAGS